MSIQITNTHLQKLAPSAFESYVTELVSDCDESFPYLKKTMGEQGLREALKQGVEKAKEAGFTQRGPVKFYIELLIVFGWEFYTDPQYYWIEGILRKNSQLSQIERSTKLYNQIKRYAEFTSGENNQFLDKLVDRLNALNIDNIKVYKDTFVEDVQSLLAHLYPEKYQLIGAKAIEQLIQESVKKAWHKYQFTQVNYVSLVTILMFLLGHQYDNDPFCAWVVDEKTLTLTSNNNTTPNSQIKASWLEKRVKIWLNITLKNQYPTNINIDLL